MGGRGHTGWMYITIGGAVPLLVAAFALSEPPACYRHKEPLGCADCGNNNATLMYCEEGCELGGPGRTGPGVLKTWYCYIYDGGEHATWPCDDPQNPVPEGWSMTLCPANSSGMCCITDDSANPDQSANVTGNSSCEHGNACTDSGTGQSSSRAPGRSRLVTGQANP